MREERKRKLKEKREKAEEAEKLKPSDHKIKIVAKQDFTDLHNKFGMNESDSDTDADEDTIVNRLAIAKKMLRKKDKHQIIDES